MSLVQCVFVYEMVFSLYRQGLSLTMSNLGSFHITEMALSQPYPLTDLPTLYFQSLHNSITAAHNSYCKPESSINITRPGRAVQSTDQCMYNFILKMQFKCSDQKRRSQPHVWISFVNHSYLITINTT